MKNSATSAIENIGEITASWKRVKWAFLFYLLVLVILYAIAGLWYGYLTTEIRDFIVQATLKGLFFPFFYFFCVILKNQILLFRQATYLVDRDLPKIIKEQVSESLQSEGANLLKDTIVHGVIEDAVGASSGKLCYNQIALQLLRALHGIDERLAPAIKIMAKFHLNELCEELGNLQHDNASCPILGREQVDISEAFADQAGQSILFFDPVIYPDISVNWTHAFNGFLSQLKAKDVTKKQYILCERAVYDDPQSNVALMAFRQNMENVGFDVYLVSKTVTTEGRRNSNFDKRLEVYDDMVAFKVESKTAYNEREDISITARLISSDQSVENALTILKRHGKKISAMS